jgi:hypothetical protein
MFIPDRISDPTLSFPDPGLTGSRILIRKNIEVFLTQKTDPKLSKIRYGMFIRILDLEFLHPGSATLFDYFH